MNPFVITTIVTVGASLLATLGYLAYQTFSANEPHREHIRSQNNQGDFTNWDGYAGECNLCHKQIGFNQRTTLNCHHFFHRSCILKWQQSRGSAGRDCPNCKVCSICLKSINLLLASRLSCGHYFHSSCITRWKKDKNNSDKYCPDCPVCTICLEYVRTDEKILSCKHMFHKKCIEKWRELKQTCPNCNKYF